MNIDDVKTSDVIIPEGSLFKAIFDHQLALGIKYGPIERVNGFWHPDKIAEPIDNAQFQAWLKSMFWRATEEIAEAFEVTDSKPRFWVSDWRKQWETDADVRHFFEELADALHFITEASVYCAVDPAMIDAIWKDALVARTTVWDLSTIRSHGMSFICGMGVAANCLKNKPWKNTQMTTDADKFHRRLVDAWNPFCQMWADMGFELSDVYVLYLKKNAVNHFRQRSNY